MEAVRLRVKDVDFNQNQITIREAKGGIDRVTMLPASVKDSLARHLDRVKLLHQRDLKEGFGRVYLPYAIASGTPGAKRAARGKKHKVDPSPERAK